MKFIQLVTTTLAMLLIAVSAQAQSYSAQAGDVIAVEVLEDPSLNRNVLVLPDGRISFPFAGSIRVAGRTSDQIQVLLRDGMASNFAAPPTVFVAIEPPVERREATTRTIDIFFMGEFNTQGTLELDRGTTLLQALAASGGLTRFAATKRIQLRRGNKAYKFNYHALVNGGSAGVNPVLQNGDVIVAPERRLFE